MKYCKPFKDTFKEKALKVINNQNEYIKAAKKVPLTYYRPNPKNENGWSDAFVDLREVSYYEFIFNDDDDYMPRELKEKTKVAYMLMNKIAINDKNTSKEDYISGLLSLINENPRNAENYRRYACPILQLDDPEDVKNYEKAKAKYKNACQYFEKSWDSDHIPIKQACKQLKKDSENQKNLEYEEESINDSFKNHYTKEISLMLYIKLRNIIFNFEDLNQEKILNFLYKVECLHETILNFLNNKYEPLKDKNAISSIIGDVCSILLDNVKEIVKRFEESSFSYGLIGDTELIEKTRYINERLRFLMKVCEKSKTGEKNLSDIRIALDSVKIAFDHFKKKVKSMLPEEANKTIESCWVGCLSEIIDIIIRKDQNTRKNESIKSLLSEAIKSLDGANRFLEIAIKKRKILDIENSSSSSSSSEPSSSSR